MPSIYPSQREAHFQCHPGGWGESEEREREGGRVGGGGEAERKHETGPKKERLEANGP